MIKNYLLINPMLLAFFCNFCHASCTRNQSPNCGDFSARGDQADSCWQYGLSAHTLLCTLLDFFRKSYRRLRCLLFWYGECVGQFVRDASIKSRCVVAICKEGFAQSFISSDSCVNHQIESHLIVLAFQWEPKWSVVFPSIHCVEGRTPAGWTFSARSFISDSTQGCVEHNYASSHRVALNAITLSQTGLRRRRRSLLQLRPPWWKQTEPCSE